MVYNYVENKMDEYHVLTVLQQICYRKPKERVVFLFSDILIYAKPKFMKARDQKKYGTLCLILFVIMW